MGLRESFGNVIRPIRIRRNALVAQRVNLAVAESLERRTLLAGIPLYWDPNQTATPTGGSGTWNTETSQWLTSASGGTLVPWNNDGNHTAVFPTADGNPTVDVSENVNVDSLSFLGGGYSLTDQQITFTGDDSQITTASGASVAISASIEVTDGSNLTISGSVDNQGSVSIDDGANLQIDTGSFTNDGTIMWNDGDTLSITSGDTIVNNGRMIEYNGQLTADANSIQNNGGFSIEGGTTSAGFLASINISGSVGIGGDCDLSGLNLTGGTYQVDGTATIYSDLTVTNAGLVVSGDLEIYANLFLNSGSTLDDQGTVNLYGNLNLEGGAATIDNGAQCNALYNSGGTLDAGTLTICNGGQMNIESCTFNINSAATLDDQGSLVVSSGTLNVNAGVLSVDSGASLDLTDDSTLFRSDDTPQPVYGTFSIDGTPIQPMASGNDTVPEGSPYTLSLFDGAAQAGTAGPVGITAFTVYWGDGSVPDAYSLSSPTDTIAAAHTFALGIDNPVIEVLSLTNGYGNICPVELSQLIGYVGVVPVPPANLTATEQTAGEVDLSWSYNVDLASGFVVTAVSPNYSSIITHDLGPDTFSDSFTGLPADENYRFTVVAEAQLYDGTPRDSDAATLTAAASAVSLSATGPSGLSEGTTSPGVLTLYGGGSSYINHWTLNWTDADGIPQGSTQTLNADGGTLVIPTPTTTTSELVAQVTAFRTSGTSGTAFTLPPVDIAIAPTAPTDLTATTFSSSQINLTWTDHSNLATTDTIYASDDDGSTFSALDQVDAASAGSSNSYQATGLDSGTSYQFYVTADTDFAESPASNTVSPAVTPGIPEPEDLTATAVLPSEVDLTWDDPAGLATGFEVQRSADGGATWTTLDSDFAASSAGTIYTYPDTTAPDGTDCFYQIIGTNATAVSNPSASADADTPVVAPTSFTATAAADGSSVALDWDEDSSDTSGDMQFEIDRSQDSGATWNTVTVTDAGDTSDSYVDTDVLGQTTYDYRIQALNSVSESNYATASVTTNLAVPASPTNLSTGTVTSTSVVLNWSAGTGAGGAVAGYTVSVSTDEGQTYGISYNTTGTSYTVIGLSPSSTYLFQVTANNSAGQSDADGPVGAQTPALTHTAPTNLQSTSVAPNSVTLTWTDTNTDETSVEVWRQDPTTANPYLLATLAPGTTSYTDIGLIGGTQYTYLVRSVKGDAYALFSSADQVTTPAGDVPILGSITSQSGQDYYHQQEDELSLPWTAASDVTSVQIQYRNDSWPDSSWTNIKWYDDTETGDADIPASWSPLTFGAQINSSYHFRIRGETAAGYTAWSSSPVQHNTATATSTANPVASLTIEGVTNTTITVSWSALASGQTVECSDGVDDNDFHVDEGDYGDTATFYGLNPGAYYTVVGCNQDKFTQELSVTTTGATPPNNGPYNLMAWADSSGSAVNLAWDSTAGNSTGFELQFSDDPTFPETQATSTVYLPGNQFDYVDQLQSPWTEEYYRVAATKSGFVSSFSNTAVVANVQLVAHRTGQNFGIPLSPTDENSNDPLRYTILVDDTYTSDPDGLVSNSTLDYANTPDSGRTPVDDDLAEVTLRQLNPNLTNGTVSIGLSGDLPNSVKLFADDGSLIYDGTAARLPLSMDLSNPGTSWLAALLQHDVNIWVQGISTNPDFVISIVYSGDAAAQDQVHMRIVDLSPIFSSNLLSDATEDPLDQDQVPVTSKFRYYESGLNTSLGGDTITLGSQQVAVFGGQDAGQKYFEVYYADSDALPTSQESSNGIDAVRFDPGTTEIPADISTPYDNLPRTLDGVSLSFYYLAFNYYAFDPEYGIEQDGTTSSSLDGSSSGGGAEPLAQIATRTTAHNLNDPTASPADQPATNNSSYPSVDPYSFSTFGFGNSNADQAFGIEMLVNYLALYGGPGQLLLYGFLNAQDSPLNNAPVTYFHDTIGIWPFSSWNPHNSTLKKDYDSNSNITGESIVIWDGLTPSAAAQELYTQLSSGDGIGWHPVQNAIQNWLQSAVPNSNDPGGLYTTYQSVMSSYVSSVAQTAQWLASTYFHGIALIGEGANIACVINDVSQGDYLSIVNAVPLLGRWMSETAIGAGALFKIQMAGGDAVASFNGTLCALLRTGCFPAGTIVHTAAGPKAIQDVQAGDKVLSFNPDTDSWEFDPVITPFSLDYSGVMVTVQAGGDSINLTAQHPVYVISGANLAYRSDDNLTPSGPGAWIYAQNLEVGDRVLAEDGQVVVVTALTSSYVNEPVYSLSVANSHTFSVGGIGLVVHNGCSPVEYKSIVSLLEQDFDVTLEQIGNRWRIQIEGVTLINAGKALVNGGYITAEVAGEQFKIPFGLFPDFTEWLYPVGKTGVKNTVDMPLAGLRPLDEATANKLAGFPETPAGYVWHHNQVLGKMQLVEKAVHNAVRHTGGFALFLAFAKKFYSAGDAPGWLLAIMLGKTSEFE